VCGKAAAAIQTIAKVLQQNCFSKSASWLLRLGRSSKAMIKKKDGKRKCGNKIRL